MKIRLGTFNLYQFVEPPYAWYNKKDKFTDDQWLEKTAWIKNQIRKMDCDIIGFQEVFSYKALRKIVKALGFEHFKVVDVAKRSKHDKYKYVTTTVALASKYPIANVQVVEPHKSSISKHNLEGAFKFSRVPIKAMVTLPNNKELLVYVCHLKSNRLNEFEYLFNAEHSMEHKKDLTDEVLEGKHAKALKQRLCEVSSLFYDIKQYKNTPKVLLCDLNDKEFSITIDALSNPAYHDSKQEANLVLYDASYSYTPKVYNPHPEAKAPKRKATSYFLGKGNVLDFIFISNDFNVTDYTVIDTHLQDNKEGSLFTSDHAQVVCELTMLHNT